MIIQPEFLDHYKTRRLCKKAGSDGVFGLLRLWGVCQLRRQWVFDITPENAEAMAHWEGEPGALWGALKDCGWIDMHADGTWEMHDWAQNNRVLVTRWENGTTTKQIFIGKKARPASASHKEGESKANGSESVANEGREGGDIDIDIENKKEKGKKKKKGLPDSIREGVAEFVRLAQERLEPMPPQIVDAYEKWADFRARKKAIITGHAAQMHFDEVERCLDGGLSAEQVVAMFRQSESMGWTGWFYEDDFLKRKARMAGGEKRKSPTPNGDMVPGGYIPGGAMEGGDQ